MPNRLLSSLLLAAALAACPPARPPPDAGLDAGPVLDGPALLGKLDCDPLAPTCGYPFPSNVYLADDAATVTHKRVAFGKTTLPLVYRDAHMDPAYYADLDGFSPNVAPMTHLPGATVTGCPGVETIEPSLLDASPTIIIEADTGARVAHWTELDQTSSDPADQAFMLRPAKRLKDATRYIVAIRDVKDSSGAALPPSPAFAALRDGTPSDDPSVGPRRALYADVFAKLAAAGVPKANLQLAWDFSTASKQALTGWMVAMRDDALNLVGADGPAYAITAITPNPNPYVAKRIEGTFHVPLYLDKVGPGARLNLVNGVPKQNGWADFPFLVQIPNSVAADAAPAA